MAPDGGLAKKKSVAVPARAIAGTSNAAPVAEAPGPIRPALLRLQHCRAGKARACNWGRIRGRFVADGRSDTRRHGGATPSSATARRGGDVHVFHWSPRDLLLVGASGDSTS